MATHILRVVSAKKPDGQVRRHLLSTGLPTEPTGHWLTHVLVELSPNVLGF